MALPGWATDTMVPALTVAFGCTASSPREAGVAQIIGPALARLADHAGTSAIWPGGVPVPRVWTVLGVGTVRLGPRRPRRSSSRASPVL